MDAGKVELDGAQYLGFTLPFSISQLVWIEALLVGGAEVYRNGATDLEERIYPGAPSPEPSPDLYSTEERARWLRAAGTSWYRIARKPQL